MFERFTDRARKVMALATQEVHRLRHEYIGTEHILLGLMMEEDGVAANVLKHLGLDLSQLRQALDKLVKHGPGDVTVTEPPLTPRGNKAIENAAAVARELGHDYIGTEHLLLGVLRDQDGVAPQMLTSLGLELERVREETLNLLRIGSLVEVESSGSMIVQAIRMLVNARETAGKEGNTSLVDGLGKVLISLDGLNVAWPPTVHECNVSVHHEVRMPKAVRYVAGIVFLVALMMAVLWGVHRLMSS